MTSIPRVRLKKCPSILQMEAVECGAASLAMVLAHYGVWIPLEELRVTCGISRDGSKASNLVKAARHYGMEAKGFRYEPENLSDLTFPLIIHWEFNHFVVLEGIKNGKAYLQDPASGQRIVPWEDFLNSYTGIALQITAGEQFKPQGKKPNVWKTLGDRLKPESIAIYFILLVSLALIIPGLVIPVFTKVFVDDYLIKQLDNWLKPIIVAMVVTLILQALLTWLQQNAILRLNQKIKRKNAGQIFAHLLRLPMRFFDQRHAGDVIARIHATSRIASLLSNELAASFFNSFTVIFYIIVMAFYAPLLTLFSVGLLLLNVVIFKALAKRRDQISQAQIKEVARHHAETLNGIYAIETLKATGRENDFLSRLFGFYTKSMSAQQQLQRYDQILAITPSLLFVLANAVVLGYGGYLVMQGDMTLGGLMAFQVLLGATNTPISGLMQISGSLQSIKGDLLRSDDILNTAPEKTVLPKFDRNPTITPFHFDHRLSGKIEFRDVTFGYSPLDPPLIENFNLTIHPGQRVALVGRSGSGKSTVAKLLLGAYPLWSGDIFLDGISLTQFSRRELAESIAAVNQDIFLFEGSFRENLTLWDETLSWSDMIQAAKDAEIHDLVSSRPGGYHGKVEEGGRNLSGGQAQRLEIARALIRQPSILILDEATSALDANTEQLIDRNLRRRSLTSLIVAHRLSTIRDSDLILVMQQGKVVEQGQHDQLKQLNGVYAQLIQGTL